MHNEEINQKISGLIDAELGYDDTLDLLKTIQADDGLKAKMGRYQAISEALKTDAFYQVSPGFSNKVFQEIQREPAYFLPQLKPTPQPHTRQLKRNTLIAIAASTVAVAVLVGQSLRTNPTTTQYETVAATTITPQQLPASFPKAEKLKPYNRQPLAAQFNDYLQAHNSSVYINGEAVFQPYAQVTSYGQR
jgi:sigma-E factor negative regulatory protein RseA